MKIDCERCPACGRECGDCMMSVFFGTTTSGYDMGDAPDADGAELLNAIDVFVDTDLISPATADAAILGVDAGGVGIASVRRLRLRAV